MPTELPTRDVLDPVIGVLKGHVSMPTAQSILGIARQRAGIATAAITRAQLRDMLPSIERSLAFFVASPVEAKACFRALEALASAASGPAEASVVTLHVRVEDDIARARAEARKLAATVGFSHVGQTRIMTAVSELARNIVQYAGEGQIDLTPAPKGIEIVAKDRGPGIPHLDQVMSGNYRSRLGMGLGLRGVKQLAERFDVTTAAGRGTTVIALVRMV